MDIFDPFLFNGERRAIEGMLFLKKI